MTHSKYRQLIRETVEWLQQQPHTLLLSPQTTAFFSCQKCDKKSFSTLQTQTVQKESPLLHKQETHTPKKDIPLATQKDEEIEALLKKAPGQLKLKTTPYYLLLLFYSEEEKHFYEKLGAAIDKHLHPTKLLSIESWKQESHLLAPKWILATKRVTDKPDIPFISLDAPSLYQNDPAAKSQLWKMLCSLLSS